MTRLVVPDNTPELYAQSGRADPLVYAIITHAITEWFWLVTEHDPKTRHCFGLVIGFETELGYFDLRELEQEGANLLPCPTPEPLSVVRARYEQEGDE
jgi:hypothetical protein